MTVESAGALLRRQAGICGELGSPLTRALLQEVATDLMAGGPVREILRDELEATAESAMPLRFAAAVHRLVLTGRAPALAPFYPSVGGIEDAASLGPALRETVEANADELRRLLALPCQTNEVGRCAALVLGFLETARETGLPLRLLEIGSSAGLNLRWDRYRYEQGEAAWGPSDSPVRLAGRWDRPPDVFSAEAEVAGRLGCDPHALDPGDPEGALTLRSSVWADQTERLRLLEGGLAVAAEVPATVDRERAGPWLERRLAQPSPGVATVVFHSVVLQYLEREERKQVAERVRGAGARATSEAPVAWLSVEPQEIAKQHQVRLTIWPEGETRVLALTGPHGDPVDLTEEGSGG